MLQKSPPSQKVTRCADERKRGTEEERKRNEKEDRKRNTKEERKRGTEKRNGKGEWKRRTEKANEKDKRKRRTETNPAEGAEQFEFAVARCFSFVIAEGGKASKKN